MTSSPAAVDVMAEEWRDFVAVDLEHTPVDIETIQLAALAANETECAILARVSLHSADHAKRALDRGAPGIIVPSANSTAEARAAVTMARFPPYGTRGALSFRATGYRRQFAEYFEAHKREVAAVVMLDHREAARKPTRSLRCRVWTRR